MAEDSGQSFKYSKRVRLNDCDPTKPEPAPVLTDSTPEMKVAPPFYTLEDLVRMEREAKAKK